MDKQQRRQQIAEIIFMRFTAQVAGVRVKDDAWSVAHRGWIENPALFPLVEVCLDAADEILSADEER